jgi:Fe-S cluster assembly protein SufD
MTEPVKVISKKTKITSTHPKDFSFVSAPRLTGDEGIDVYRSEAWEAFNELSMPTSQEEAWRRTDLRAFSPGNFKLHAARCVSVKPDISGKLLKPLAGEKPGGQIILSPDSAYCELLPEFADKGVLFTDLLTAEKKYPRLVEKILGKIVYPKESKFAALTSACAQTGVFLYVPKNIEVTLPLHSILWGEGTGLAYLSHLLIWLEEGASVVYLHETASSPDEAELAMHSGIVEIWVGEGAKLQFIELQSWGKNVWNFSHERAKIERDGNLEWVVGAIGSRITKNFTEIDMTGQGSNSRVSGFYFTNGSQHIDYDTRQNHLAPHTTSDLLFKGALKGKSRTVWHGMIYVAPGAVKADGYQANRNILISEGARADSIPGLEILTDDVRCTHGATVGKIDQDQIFYARSRGIPQTEAEQMIIEGFFDQIMQRVPFEGIKNQFQYEISQRVAED